MMDHFGKITIAAAAYYDKSYWAIGKFDCDLCYNDCKNTKTLRDSYCMSIKNSFQIN